MTLFLLKLTLCWGFFALLYSLLLRHETFFRANRAYLLGTAGLGILLAAWPAEQMPVPVDDGGVPVIVLPEFTVSIQQVEAATSTWQDVDFLRVAYWLGFALMAARVLWGLLKIVRMAIRGKSERLPDGCLLIQTAEAKVPFSFFRWVFVPVENQLSESSKLSESSNAETALMLAHERAHAKGWHSIDVLFAEVLCVVFWFHPLAHWYRRGLRSVHEYLADAAASRHADRKQYGLLLLGQSQYGMPIAFANHFFQSPLKQRIIMLMKDKSAPARSCRYSLLLPLSLLFVLLFQKVETAAQTFEELNFSFNKFYARNPVISAEELEKANWVFRDTDYAKSGPDAPADSIGVMVYNFAPFKYDRGEWVYKQADERPRFWKSWSEFAKENSTFFQEKAQKEGTPCVVWVKAIIEKNGTISNVELITPKDYPDNIFPAYPQFRAEAARLVSLMHTGWTPARHKGELVRYQKLFQIEFGW